MISVQCFLHSSYFSSTQGPWKGCILQTQKRLLEITHVYWQCIQGRSYMLATISLWGYHSSCLVDWRKLSSSRPAEGATASKHCSSDAKAGMMCGTRGWSDRLSRGSRIPNGGKKRVPAAPGIPILEPQCPMATEQTNWLVARAFTVSFSGDQCMQHEGMAFNKVWAPNSRRCPCNCCLFICWDPYTVILMNWFCKNKGLDVTRTSSHRQCIPQTFCLLWRDRFLKLRRAFFLLL